MHYYASNPHYKPPIRRNLTPHNEAFGGLLEVFKRLYHGHFPLLLLLHSVWTNRSSDLNAIYVTRLTLSSTTTCLRILLLPPKTAANARELSKFDFSNNHFFHQRPVLLGFGLLGTSRVVRQC